MSNRKDTLDIKSFIFESDDLKTIEEQVNVYFQQNRVFEISNIDFRFDGMEGTYIIQGSFNPTNMKKDKSDIEVIFFTAKDPNDSVGIMNRFLMDNNITGYYVRAIQTAKSLVSGEETLEPLYVTSLTYLKPDRSHNVK